MKAKLYRVWVGWSDEGSGNRDELLRILANSYDQALTHAKKELLKNPDDPDITEEEFGVMWGEQPDHCDCDDPDDHYCGTTYYIDLDEIEEYTEDDLSLNLLTPTLGSYDAYRNITAG